MNKRTEILDCIWFAVAVLLVFFAFGGIAHSEDYRIEMPPAEHSVGC